MTDAQKAAHQRLLATLPSRFVGDADEPEFWAAKDRGLSPDEIPYLLATEEMQ